ncbi:AraC family transcriptional regulator [Streptomyces sp. NRRL B-24484]|uniref:helix-turn-helix domain-containing protein n=1 Tax=Streptomyces sp. NRRL B-24484 TaxID=1463833 RepID=UPI000A667284|nr:AraC family transcriptional regulator [Streptomyces sp. NRRL B-24484]
MDEALLDAGVADEGVRVRPTGAMARYAAWYSGYRQAGLPPGRHRGLPSPWLTLIFTLDDPLTVAVHPEPGRGPQDYTALLGGLHTTPALITNPGRQSGIQVALDPLAARPLLGLPAGELAGLDLPAEDLLGPLADEVRERLLAAPDWPGRFAVLDALLPRLAEPYGEAAPEVRRVWALLRRSGGRLPVSALAAEAGWSERHLAARFRLETGLSPKAAARVVRFDRARRMAASDGGRLAELAARCGYFDQAHLAREFRALAGVAPSVWLAEEFRFVQAGVPAAVQAGA